jgi:hypothetical protein
MLYTLILNVAADRLIKKLSDVRGLAVPDIFLNVALEFSFLLLSMMMGTVSQGGRMGQAKATVDRWMDDSSHSRPHITSTSLSILDATSIDRTNSFLA